MKYLLFLILVLLGCEQKKIYYIFPSIKEQKAIVYFDIQEGRGTYLKQDSQNNFIVDLTKNSVVYSSTNFKNVQYCRPIFCFKDSLGEKCFDDEFRLNEIGYKTIIYSKFTKKNTSKNDFDSSSLVIIMKQK